MRSGMTSHLFALCFDALDPRRLAHFWAGVLGWELADDHHAGIALLPSDGTPFPIRFLPTQEPKAGPNQMHLADPEGNEFCVIEPGSSFLAGCGFLGEVACDGSQEVGYFWSEALGWPLVWDQDQETAIQSPGGGTKIAWGGPPLSQKTKKNRMHFDLASPADGDLQSEVDRLVSRGATRIDVGQSEVSRVVMADPDGHEFCVLGGLDSAHEQ